MEILNNKTSNIFCINFDTKQTKITEILQDCPWSLFLQIHSSSWISGQKKPQMVQDVFTAGIKLTQPCICKCDNKGKVHDDEEVIKSSHVLSSPDRQNFQWIQNIR